MSKIYVDFSCPNCGQRHRRVELGITDDYITAMAFDIECVCDTKITVFAELESKYLSVTAMNFDQPTLVYKEGTE